MIVRAAASQRLLSADEFWRITSSILGKDYDRALAVFERLLPDWRGPFTTALLETRRKSRCQSQKLLRSFRIVLDHFARAKLLASA